MLRLAVEVPPRPMTFMARPTPEFLAPTLAGRIIGTGNVSVTATAVVLRAVNGLGLYAVRLVAPRSAPRAAEGLFTGLVGGLGASASQKSELAPWITVAAGIAGYII